MADKEELSTGNTSQTTSSSLTDSWSMVNQHGDILDDESCSTTSSVEVVDEEEEDVSQQTSLGTSPEVTTPKGPLFVLRLSSHEVSDTDDDQTSSGVTDSIAHSQSFDVLNDRNPADLTSQSLEISNSSHDGKSDNGIDIVPNNAMPEEKLQTRYPSVNVEEQLGSLVKAINEVQQNFQSTSGRIGISKSQSKSDIKQQNGSKHEQSESFHNNEGPGGIGSNRQPSMESGKEDVLVETVGPVLQTSTDGVEESLGSNFSFLGDNIDAHEAESSPDTSESTIMDQSIERTEHPGSQQMVDSAEGVEPDTNLVEEETGNQTELHSLELGKKMEQVYTFVKDIFLQWRQGLTRDSVIAYMSAVVVIMFLASTYTAYTVVVKKEKTTKYVEEFQHLLDNYNYVQEELNRCRSSQESLKLELSKVDTSCEVSLKEANTIIRKWTYTSIDNFKAEADQFFQESEFSCSRLEKGIEENVRNSDHMDSTKERANTLTFLLKRLIEENSELKKSLQVSHTEIAKLKDSLEDTEYKLEQAERDLFEKRNEKERRRYTDGQENSRKDESPKGAKTQQEFDSNADREAGSEDEQRILFDKCLNVIMEYSHKILQEKYNTHWHDFGGHSIKDHLLSYLENIMPENLWYFMQAVKPPSTTSDEPTDGSEDEQQESGYTQGTSWFGRRKETEKDSEKKTGEPEYGDSGFDKYDHREWNSNEHGKQSGQTGSLFGHWTDSVYEMMNKTRVQLQDTWQQVKNVSEEMWTKHKPAITKLHDTFSRKIQQLSDKFQQKLAKKVQKWFNRSKNRRRKNKSKSKDSGEPNFAKTSRRGNEDDDIQPNQPTHRPDICSRDIIDIQNTILSLNARKFKKLDNQRHILKALKRIRNKEQLTERDVKSWLDCQIDWWSNNVPKPLELPQYLVTERCFDFVECWQIHVSEGNHGIGRKKCRRVKRASGNIMEDICKGTSYFFGVDEDLYDRTDESPDVDQQLNNEREWDATGQSDDYNDDYDDDVEDISDEEIENWFLRRAEMREYHHAEPDNWYFRRLKKGQQEPVKHDDL